MIKISNKAKKYFLQLLLKKEKNTHIRVFVKNEGTSTAECGIAYCYTDEVHSTDIKLDLNDFFIYIDKNSAPYLKSAKIDVLFNNLNSELTIDAPYIKKIPVEHNNSLKSKIEYTLNTKINPKLSSHGGYISLINITDGYAILTFHGGCSGCSMANITLKNFIEKELLTYFPELKGVKDITEHIHNKQSYF